MPRYMLIIAVYTLVRSSVIRIKVGQDPLRRHASIVVLSYVRRYISSYIFFSTRGVERGTIVPHT